MLRLHTTTGGTRATRRAASAVIAAAALGAALLAGCSADGGSTAGSLADQSAGGGTAVQRQSDSAKAAPGVAEGTSTDVADQAELQRKLTRQANLSLTVKNVDGAAADIRSIAVAAKGLVLSEQLNADARPDARSSDATGYGSMTISVPSDQLDATLDRISRLGTVVSRVTSTEDVTSTYVDTQSRLATMRASVTRVRALMSRATKIGDVVALESELAKREADLEALQAQLTALDSAVAMSPVSIRLSTVAPAPTPAATTGFLGGFRAGWDAFTTTVQVALTGLGAALPFAMAGAVVVVPLVIWLRRRRPTVTPPAAPPVAPPATPAAQA
jgi:hypothetical protein